jgi:hypothetical protein
MKDRYARSHGQHGLSDDIGEIFSQYRRKHHADHATMHVRQGPQP